MNKIFIVLSGMFMAANVSAACKTQHLNGEWVAYQVAVPPANSVNLKATHTGRCVLSVEDGTGTVDCEMTLMGGITPSGDLDVTVYPDCSAEMTWMLDNNLTAIFEMQLSRNKQSYTGRFVAENPMGKTVVLGTSNGIQR